MLEKLKNLFLRSETILIARIQYWAGLILGVVIAMDPNVFQASIPSKYWPIFLVAFGVALEWARKRNDPSLGANPNVGKEQ